MLEIHPKFQLGTKFDETRRISKYRKRQKISKFQSIDAYLEDLYRLKKNLLLKRTQNASRFTAQGRESFRVSDEQVKMLTSMLPDEIIRNTSDSEIRHFECAVFFADISGFTDLSDKYQNLENGASKLSMVLNFYLGSMVQEILSHGGDIIKYAGDAFIAVFRPENDLILQDAVHRAIDSALIIQKSCSNFHTEISGLSLNVKIAISGGEVCFSTIGNEQSAHYVIVGDPVWQVKSLQENIKAGEVLVTPKAWFSTQESLYQYTHFKDARHYKVTGMKDMEGTYRQHEAVMNFYEMKKKLEGDDLSSATSLTAMDTSLEPFGLEIAYERSQKFSLRPSVSLDNKSKKFIRRFIIAPVLNAIDLSDPIEFLTEMRNVVIVFANFVVAKSSTEELVKIVDSVYTDLCRIVSSYEGIVNKVSLFDKDMMFLVIFGLRGFKHELESRIGLRCASEIIDTFKSRQNVISVSAGVTSGMSYCGVVGHSLRREYSVISVTVNKAARLMIAYPGIVSCDSQTLLSSKMELKHFVMLPKKVLKGLHDEVVAYEFKEVHEAVETTKPVFYEFPMLGRDEVLTMYRQLLITARGDFIEQVKEVRKSKHNACLLIKGETQSGKTRILDEIFTNCLNDNIKCFRLTLNAKFSKVSYQTLSTIVKRALKVESNEDALKIIEKKFASLNADPCFLNVIFDVSCEPKQRDSQESCEIEKIMIKNLYAETFKEFWVLLIDDIEFMDEESFESLEFLFDLKSVFSIFTLGQQRKMTEKRRRLFHENRVVNYSLKPIELKHQNQLVCQHLEVSGLSLELEKFLHMNSNGNPGWIETCTKSLLHSNRVEIKSMQIKEAFDIGFIINESAIRPKNTRTYDERNLFEQCFRESKFIDQSQDKMIKVAICKLPKHYKEIGSITKADNDLMVYDALTSYEQLVCKCASVIGVKFKRKMLAYIMSSSTDRMIGRAMVKLFELEICACASRLTDQESKRKKDSNIIGCNCEMVVIFDSCRDLPRYACCSSISFQRESFRTVVYDSLTDKQRLEYSKRSLIYLHTETNRCDSCGNGAFTELMLEDFDFKFRDGIVESSDNSFESMVKYFDSIELPIVRPPKSSIIGRVLSSIKAPETRPVMLNYVNYDFRNCKCNLILYSMFNESIQHCHGSGNLLKLIEYKIELASMCIKMSNVPGASILLEKVLSRLENNQFDEGSLFPSYLRGKAYTLQGVCRSNMSQDEQALELYYKSCNIFAVNFPKTCNLGTKIKLQNLIRSARNSLKQNKFSQCSKLTKLITNLLSETLSLMFRIFMHKKLFDLAKLAAFWGLAKALKIDSDFSELAQSFANVFEVIFYTRDVERFIWLQDKSLVRITRKLFSQDLTMGALTSIIGMYRGVMLWQIARKKLRLAVQVGELTKSLCSRVHATKLQTEIVPELFLMLMNLKRIRDAFSLLQRFETAMKVMNDKNGMIWYHALCLDVLLDTGFTIVSYEDCSQFYLKEITTIRQDGTPEALSRFFANLLLWSIRHGVFEISQVWLAHLKQFFTMEPHGSLNNVFTGLRVIEALILQLAFAIEDRNIELFTYFDQKLKGLTRIVKIALKVPNCFKERFELQLLHFELVKRFKKKNLKQLKNMKEKAVKNLNYLSLELIKHSERTWKCELTPAIRNFWINHSSKANAISLSQIDFPDRIFPYSLPIPKSGSF